MCCGTIGRCDLRTVNITEQVLCSIDRCFIQYLRAVAGRSGPLSACTEALTEAESAIETRTFTPAHRVAVELARIRFQENIHFFARIRVMDVTELGSWKVIQAVLLITPTMLLIRMPYISSSDSYLNTPQTSLTIESQTDFVSSTISCMIMLFNAT